MAATRLIPLHRGKGKTIAECLKERTDYTENKEKTEDGKYISSYACDVKTADEEFMLSRREYEQCFRSARKDEVIAYQIRQSFKPGEITPELANKIGYELAMRFTGGRHAFTICTHTDKRHIHNHITFNSITIDGKRKFNNYSFSAMTVRKISDMLCLENGLSVIKPVRADRNEASRNLMSLVDIEKAMLAGKGPGYERWAKVFNVKQMAKSLLFLQEHGIKDYEELKTRIQKIKQDIADTREEIDRCEEKLTANKELQTHIINYSKSGGTDEAARKAFRKFKYGQLPKMKQLRKEHEDLWQQKKNSYSSYSGAKKELKEYLIAKKNLDLIMESGEAAGSQPQAVLEKSGLSDKPTACQEEL